MCAFARIFLLIRFLICCLVNCIYCKNLFYYLACQEFRNEQKVKLRVINNFYEYRQPRGCQSDRSECPNWPVPLSVMCPSIYFYCSMLPCYINYLNLLVSLLFVWVEWKGPSGGECKNKKNLSVKSHFATTKMARQLICITIITLCHCKCVSVCNC